MKITKEVIVCLIIGAILILFGTSVKSYVFEALAIVIIAFGVWDDLFKTNNKNTQEKREDKNAIVI